MFDKIQNFLFYKAYRLNLHLDLVTLKRWKWRKFLLKNKKVLEIGSGGGPWTIELLIRGNEVTSIDINASTLNHLKRKKEIFPIKNKKLKLVHCHARDFQTPERFDQIILFEVLEHIKDDELTLKNLSRLLKPSGNIVISAPSDNFKEFYGTYDKNISQTEDGGHVRKGYSHKRLKELLEAAGLKVVHEDSCAGFFTKKCLAFGWYLADRISSGFIFRIFLNLTLWPITYLDFLYPSYPGYINFIMAEKPG